MVKCLGYRKVSSQGRAGNSITFRVGKEVQADLMFRIFLLSGSPEMKLPFLFGKSRVLFCIIELMLYFGVLEIRIKRGILCQKSKKILNVT